MTTTRTITRFGATAAALLLLTGAGLAGPASARDGADDNPSISDDSANRTAADDNPSAGEDSTNRAATDDNPSIGDDSASRASTKNRARKVKRGNCTAATDWKLKAKPRDGRIEVEFEVDSNRAGQRWTYTLRHDRTVKASGTRTTKAPSGSFSVERRLTNAPGVHTIRAKARNTTTGSTSEPNIQRQQSSCGVTLMMT